MPDRTASSEGVGRGPTGAPPTVPGVEGLVVIGRGGFGVVYRGRQPDLGRDVAVKVLSAPGADERSVELWRREVTAMGRLSNHPNIVAAFSAGVTQDGLPYLLMPYVPGGSLHDRLRDHGPLPGADAARVGGRLAGGLAAAHAAGVLHRDVKPANVLMSEYGEPQLTDFGIARLVDASTTTTGSVRATIGYAAPEVLGGETATPAADVYGLGATLHAALSGHGPFTGEEGESLAARIGRVMTQPPPDLRAVGVAPALAEVIEAALAKDPDERIATADELRDRLEGVDLTRTSAVAAPILPPVTEPMIDLPPTAAAAGAGSTGGRRVAAWALGLAAILLLVVLGAFALLRSPDDDPTPVAEPTTTAPTTAAPSTESAPSTAAPTPTSTPTSPPEVLVPPTTTEAPTTTADAPEGDATEEDLRTAVEDYYGLVDDGRLDAAYALLSPRYQGEQDRGSYVRFWEGIDSVEVRGTSDVDVDAGTVSARLRYVRADGSRSDEDVVLTLIPSEEGTLLIDRYRTGGGED